MAVKKPNSAPGQGQAAGADSVNSTMKSGSDLCLMDASSYQKESLCQP